MLGFLDTIALILDKNRTKVSQDIHTYRTERQCFFCDMIYVADRSKP